MKRFTIYDLRFTVSMALLLFAIAAPAATVRVTTWNLQANSAAGTNGDAAAYRQNLIQEASEVLKKLAPDVIVLQGVQDWQSCNELVKALKPVKYNVAAWSSFRDVTAGTLSKQQVAILSKGKAYISWSEAWKNEGGASAPGGFAFAAIRLGGKNAGFFSAQFGGVATEESVQQLLGQVDSLKKWTTNRIQALAVAGDFDAGPDGTVSVKTFSRLEQAGLADVFGALPLAKRVTLPGNSKHADATTDYVFTRGAGIVKEPEIISTALTEHYPVTCDLDLDAPPVLMPATLAELEAQPPKKAVPQTNAAVNPTQTTPVVQAAAPAANGRDNTLRNVGIAAGGILLVAVIWRLTQRRVRPVSAVTMTMRTGEGQAGSSSATPQRIVIAQRPVDTAGSAADHPPTVHMEPTSSAEAQLWQQRAEEAERRATRATALARESLMAHLSEWLKSKLVQRLSSDRRQLLETQRAAALKMQVVDERLAKIELQLHERNRVYERRIEELEKELIEAQEENRELIRAKIAQVRAEMEKERAEAARQAGGKQT